ncbi:4-hydroxyphenylpyruvate dioxygenase [Nostoc sp.]|uniref:4-hydroxyphenylpyruvate dioxygenase n=1 Tax=Nostoc sp. TaxID=1180 RepID=UPI003592E86D
MMLNIETPHQGWSQHKVIYRQPEEVLDLKGIDYIELYVGNVPQAAHFYRTVFGFTPIAYAGLETRVQDRVSIVLEQGKIRLVLTGAIGSDNAIAEYVKLHGDGVKDIAFRVNHATQAFELAVRRGALPIKQPTVYESQEGRVVVATIATYGDTVHSFIERHAYNGVFFPTYRAIEEPPPVVSTGLSAIDHIAVSVEQSTLEHWVNFYCLLDFHPIQHEMVATEYSAMNSKVVQNSTSNIKFTILEPATGKSFSQIEEYLAFNGGSGSQHIAFLTDDIFSTVRALRANNIEFLTIPDAYYEMLKERIIDIDRDLIKVLQELQILVDCDQWGYLMQIFTKPFQNRPTLFMEVIQRQGARGFGSGNIKALFEAIEREQFKRGNIR